MTEPKRFLEADGDELERLLLSSALTVRPRAWVRWRGAVLFFFATLGATSGAKASVATLLKAPALRWTLVGLGTGAAALAGAQLLQQRSEPAPSVAMSAPGSSAPKLLSAPGIAVESDAARDPQVVPEPATTAASGTTAVGRRNDAKSAPLSRELEMLDSASKALGAGQPRRALERLDLYGRSFPKGALGQEALRLRIEATQASGDRAAAMRLAEEFTRRYPKSTYTQRLRSLLSSKAP